jgi:hypothetical protein
MEADTQVQIFKLKNKGITMRDMAKFKQDKKQGLFVQSMRAGAKGLTTTVIDGAINRAVRRGRISKENARNCMLTWDKQLANRPQSLKWHLYAAAQLAEAAQFRRKGMVSHARYTIQSAKFAIKAAAHNVLH